jgi:hypothetical protein
MSNYDETKHERGGNPENTGEFNEKTQGTPDPAVGAAIARPQPSAGQVFDLVDGALREAYTHISTDWVLAADGAAQRANVRAAFKEAATSIQARLARSNIRRGDVPYADRVAIYDLECIVRGADPSAGFALNQMAAVSARLGRRIIERQDQRPDVHKLERPNADLKAGDVLLGDDGFRMPISDARLEGSYIRVETPIGPVSLDFEGSQVIVVTEDVWETDPDAFA